MKMGKSISTSIHYLQRSLSKKGCHAKNLTDYTNTSFSCLKLCHTHCTESLDVDGVQETLPVKVLRHLN